MNNATSTYDPRTSRSDTRIHITQSQRFRCLSLAKGFLTLSGLAVWVALALTCIGFHYNPSGSIPIGFYRFDQHPIVRGSYIRLRSVYKRAVGLPGDTVSFGPDGVRINGRLWKDSAPKESPHCQFGTYKLNNHQYLAMGENPLAWDSRYNCFIPQTIIEGTETPVLVHEASRQ